MIIQLVIDIWDLKLDFVPPNLQFYISLANYNPGAKSIFVSFYK